MQTRGSIPFGAPILATLVACGGDGAITSREFAGNVRDSAGVEIVENSVVGLWPADGGWETAELLTIGEAAGDPDYQFGQVIDVDMASDGSILVLDSQAGRVRIYGPDGTFRKGIGGPGSGPGEFSPQLGGLFVGRGDTILVPDMGNQRITLIPPQGDPTSFPLRLEQGMPLRFDMSKDGALIAQLRTMNFGDPAAEVAPNDVIAVQAYDGTVTDTLLTPRRGSTFEMSERGPQFRLFSAEPMWTMLGDDHVAYASNDAYRISVHDADGSLERIVTFPHETRAVSESDQQVVRELIRKQMELNGMPPEGIERMLSAVSFADNWPAFTQLRGGPEGTLWVQRLRYIEEMTQEERENWNPQLDQGSPEWDVFEADGRYGGVVALPVRFTPLTILEDRILGVYRDEFDVQYVRVLGLDAGRPAAEDRSASRPRGDAPRRPDPTA